MPNNKKASPFGDAHKSPSIRFDFDPQLRPRCFTKDLSTLLDEEPIKLSNFKGSLHYFVYQK